MVELKRDLAKANEIIVRFGNDLKKYQSEVQKKQQDLNKYEEKVRHRSLAFCSLIFMRNFSFR